MKRRATTLTLAVAAACLLVGCGDQDDSSDPQDGGTSPSSQEAGFPVTVDTPLGELRLEEKPERIVSLSPSATESLFAIGAGDQVVAADAFSTYPKEAPTTELSGFEPNIEAIAGYEPDLVVVANDANDLVKGLGELDIPVLLSPAPVTVEDGYEGVATLGLATGHPDETAALVADMREEIAAAMSEAPQSSVRVYHELDNTFYAASSNSFIGSVYEEMGARNIADSADRDESGYPQMTEEAVIAADPQLIVITDQVSYSADDVANRPGWADIAAVRNDDIVTVDADVASRWGPRLPQLVETLAQALDSVAVPTG